MPKSDSHFLRVAFFSLAVHGVVGLGLARDDILASTKDRSDQRSLVEVPLHLSAFPHLTPELTESGVFV